MDPLVLIGGVIFAVGGPAFVVSAIFKYGALNQRVENIEKRVKDVAENQSKHEESDNNAFKEVKKELQDFREVTLQRLARIEEILEHRKNL